MNNLGLLVIAFACLLSGGHCNDLSSSKSLKKGFYFDGPASADDPAGGELTPDSVSNVWTPTVDGVRAYNHGPILAPQTIADHIDLAWYCHGSAEGKSGSYTEYYTSSDNGVTWTRRDNIMPSQSPMSGIGVNGAGYVAYPTQWVFVGDQLYCVCTVLDYNGSIYTGRWFTAVPITQGVVGTPKLIYFSDGYTLQTPYDGTYPQYEFDQDLADAILPQMSLSNMKVVQGMDDIWPPSGIGDYNINEFTGAQLPDLSGWVNYGRIELGHFAGGGAEEYMCMRTSPDGNIWSDWEPTNMTNAPSKMELIRIADGRFLFTYNPWGGRSTALFCLSDDPLRWSTDEMYSIRPANFSPYTQQFFGSAKSGRTAYHSTIQRLDGKMLTAHSQFKEKMEVFVWTLPN